MYVKMVKTEKQYEEINNAAEISMAKWPAGENTKAWKLKWL